MSGKWEGGKGDQRRKGADDDKYKKGWDRIWNPDSNKQPDKKI